MKNRSLLLLVMITALAAASAAKHRKPAPAAVPSGNPATVPATYVIAPDDVLDVEVWGNPQLSRQVPVRPDGKISLPLIDDVQAAGLTATQLAAAVTDKLKKFVTDPQVTVIVTAVNSQHVYILGEVNRSGMIALAPHMTVLQALSSAGGFTNFANPKKIYILRNEDGKQVKYPFNYKDVMKGRNLDQNIELKPNDEIIVPQ